MTATIVTAPAARDVTRYPRARWLSDAPMRARLAYGVLDWIRCNRRLHSQAEFLRTGDSLRLVRVRGLDEVAECGTVACFAGWTALLDGCRLADWQGMGMVVDVDGRRTHMETYAGRRLGLDSAQRDRLFYQTGTFEELVDAVAEVFGPRPDEVPVLELDLSVFTASPLAAAINAGTAEEVDA